MTIFIVQTETQAYRASFAQNHTAGNKSWDSYYVLLLLLLLLLLLST